jgi:uncharacterized protein (DUF58 family)
MYKGLHLLVEVPWLHWLHWHVSQQQQLALLLLLLLLLLATVLLQLPLTDASAAALLPPHPAAVGQARWCGSVPTYY